MVTPEDVAQMVTFLCMLAAHMICGQVILVDSGYTLPAS
jgi:enoyl-[acyl-carrier-protein] reductase (NADH)